MPGPVERWLDTFMCGQYAEIFHRFGFETLQSVCQLQLHTLQQMGVKPEDCEKILENVSVLKQTILGYRSTAGSTPPQNVPSLPDPVSGMPAPPHHTPSPGPNPIVNPASSALRNVARNATSRGMSGTPEGSQLDPYTHPTSPGMVGPPPQNFDSAPSKPMYGPPGYVEEQYRPPPTQNVPNPPKVQQQTVGISHVFTLVCSMGPPQPCLLRTMRDNLAQNTWEMVHPTKPAASSRNKCSPR
ncbi:Transcription factor 20 [Branchiostoma belcheri]|nr:Transcription factor 20 [Branchiostoma belcheri]